MNGYHTAMKATHNDRGEFHRCNVKQKKPDTKKGILCDFIDAKIKTYSKFLSAVRWGREG